MKNEELKNPHQRPYPSVFNFSFDVYYLSGKFLIPYYIYKEAPRRASFPQLFRLLFNHGKNVVLAHHEVFLTLKLKLRTGIFAIQHNVTLL